MNLNQVTLCQLRHDCIHPPGARMNLEQERYPMKSARFGIVVLVLLAGGCATHPTNQQIGTATGAVVGGAVGSALTGGTFGTVAGAGAGAVIGGEIGKKLDRK